jgi:hypothetical protein
LPGKSKLREKHLPHNGILTPLSGSFRKLAHLAQASEMITRPSIPNVYHGLFTQTQTHE